MEKHNQELRECLESATTRTAIETIDRVKQIETRGNVEVNLRNGDVTILRPLEFVPRSTKQEPTAEFADVQVDTRVIVDVAELATIFAVPFEIQGHTKGQVNDFFHKLAVSRAELIKKHLIAQGVAEELMTPIGLPGETGVNMACVIINFDIFPDND